MSTSRGAARQPAIALLPNRPALDDPAVDNPPLDRSLPLPELDARAPQPLPRALELTPDIGGHLGPPPPDPTPRVRAFTRAELEEAWQIWLRLDRCLAEAALVIAYTGLRWNEAAALSLADLVPHAHQLIVRGSVRVRRPGPTLRPPAPRPIRRVPVGLRIRRSLRWLASRAGADGLVFTGADGGPLRPGQLVEALDWPRTAPGHQLADLRATAPRLWADDGIPAPVVAEWMGTGRPRAGSR